MSVKEYDSAKAIPNKFLNPNGTTSTLQGLIGSSSNPQSKTVNVTQNGTTYVTADIGYDSLADVTINTTVQAEPNLQSKDITITQNGTSTVQADNNYDGLSEVTITVNAQSEYNTKINTVLTNANHIVYNNITELPTIDFRNVTNAEQSFAYLEGISTVSLINTNNITSAKRMFLSCYVVSVPLFDTGKVQNMSEMFSTCRNLTTIPQFNTGKVTNFQNMFSSTVHLTDESLNNILLMCINASSYAGTKTLARLGITSTYYPASRIQALSAYQDFIDAGWTIGY